MAYASIAKPGLYMNPKLYTGNGSTQAITGVGFQPDVTWIKKRSSIESHYLYDAVRGVTKEMYPNSIAIESTDANSLTAFDADGFSVGTSNALNENTETLVSWNWKANGAGSSNEDGSITSTVSVSTTGAFSIVKYVGDGTDDDSATIGHGLGVAPNNIVIKCVTATSGWKTSNTSLGWNNIMDLRENSAEAAGTQAFGVSGVTPSTTTFTVAASSGGSHTNTSGETYMAYCWAEVKAYSKFGAYVGNGNADGTFVYTGFKPAFVLSKRTSGSYYWYMWDNRRPGYNLIDKELYIWEDAETTDTSGGLDFLSNGFKWRSSYNSRNGGGEPYIFWAFAAGTTSC